MNSSNAKSRPEKIFVESCTVEILIHLVLLVVAILPIVLIVFPVTAGALLTTMLVTAASGFIPRLQPYVTDVSESFWTMTLIFAAMALIIGSFTYASYIKNAIAGEIRNRRCKALTGTKGNELIQIVHSLWQQLRVKNTTTPSIVWFASQNILAHAQETGNCRQIQISTGLWDRVVRKDPIATVILAHEITHLTNHDPIVFRHLNAIVLAVHRVMTALGIFGLITFLIVLLQQLKLSIGGSGLDFRIMASQFLTLLIVAPLVLLIIPLSVMVVRRYVGFISSLIEVRADVSAAVWTGGREEFVKTFTSDSSVRHSTILDRAQSMLSLNLTHISESERIDLLRSPERLASPRLRYFVFSLILPMLLPIGFFTPLLLGGAFNHLLVTVPVIALHFGLLSMIIIASPALPNGLSRLRVLTLTAAICFANVLPHLNLELIGYLLAHLGFSISQPGGLGVGETTWQSVLSDVVTTLSDLNQKIFSALHGGWIIAAMAVVWPCLWRVQLKASQTLLSNSQRFRIANVTSASAAFIALLVSYDPFRNYFFSFWPLSFAEVMTQATENIPWLRLALPIMIGLICFELQMVSLHLFSRKESRSLMGK